MIIDWSYKATDSIISYVYKYKKLNVIDWLNEIKTEPYIECKDYTIGESYLFEVDEVDFWNKVRNTAKIFEEKGIKNFIQDTEKLINEYKNYHLLMTHTTNQIKDTDGITFSAIADSDTNKLIAISFNHYGDMYIVLVPSDFEINYADSQEIIYNESKTSLTEEEVGDCF